jgi:hypothetical protein
LEDDFKEDSFSEDNLDKNLLGEEDFERDERGLEENSPGEGDLRKESLDGGNPRGNSFDEGSPKGDLSSDGGLEDSNRGLLNETDSSKNSLGEGCLRNIVREGDERDSREEKEILDDALMNSIIYPKKTFLSKIFSSTN